MERQIKFRAYITSTPSGIKRKRMDYLDNKTLFEWEYDGVGMHIMQFTGLHDKNGKPIYEGDLVQRNETGCNSSYIAKYEVVYEKYYFCLKVISSETFRECSIVRNMSECEIIGNRFENPELLTKTK